MNMKSLKMTYCGIEFENPFVLASGPPTATVEMIERALQAGWSGAVTKTIKPDHLQIEDASPRFATLKQGESIIGFENIEIVSKMSLKYWVDGIKKLRAEYPNKVLIASIMGDSNKESWGTLAHTLEKAGAQAIELNFSCPHGMPEKGVGTAIGQDPLITKTITSWVRHVVSIPLIVKLTPNVTSVGKIAQAAHEGGADGLAAINTVESLIAIDIRKLTPLPDVGGQSTFGGYSGKAIKPIGLRVVAQALNAVELPIMGIGGISCGEDALEYMAVGASLIQVCTEVMIKGFGIIDEMIESTEKYMEEMNLSSLEEIRGLARKKLSPYMALDKQNIVYPEVNKELCIGCGMCVTACADGGSQALNLFDNTCQVNRAACDGCSLCSHVCPVNAITLGPRVKRPALSASMTSSTKTTEAICYETTD